MPEQGQNISSQLLLAVATCVSAAVVPKSGATVPKAHHVPRAHVSSVHAPVHASPVQSHHYGKREAEADPQYYYDTYDTYEDTYPDTYQDTYPDTYEDTIYDNTYDDYYN